MKNKKAIKLIIFVLFAVSLIILSIYFLYIQNESNTESVLKAEYKTAPGKIEAIDLETGNKITSIDLSVTEGEYTIFFNPHSAAMAPDRKYIWVCATAPQEQFKAINQDAKEHIHLKIASDQIFVIDTQTNKIAKRINVGQQLGLSDLLFTPDGKNLYISAETGSAIYSIDLQAYKVRDLIQLPPDSRPHHLGISQDGESLYTKSSANNNFYHISRKTQTVSKVNANNLPVNIKWTSHQNRVL